VADLRAAAPAEVLAMATARHHVVEASAGTGKTYLIEHRVVDLIVRGRVDVESILVVPFSVKAPAELRRRLRAKIQALLDLESDSAGPGEPAWVIDEEARARLQAALFSFDRAPVFTIHGFCNRMIAESGFAVGRALRPSQVAGPAAFAESFAEVVRTELAVEPGLRELLGAWLGSGRTASELKRHLWSCIERGGELDAAFDPARLAASIERAARFVDGGGGDLAQLHPATAAAIERRLPPVRAAIAAASAAGAPEAQLAALWTAAAEIRWIADKLGGPMAALEAELVDIHAAVATAFVPRIRRDLVARKRSRGQIDFSDMLAQLAESLEGAAGERLAAGMRDRFPFALIDEFQDTDELQWSIFSRIYLEARGAAYLTVVGDPKQAIYGFRGADLHTYLRARRELADAGAGRTVLETNYRSTAPLVDAVSQLVAGDFFSGGLDSTAAVRSGRGDRLVDGQGAAVEPVVVTEIDAGGRLAAADLLERAVEVTASEIAALVGDVDRPRLFVESEGGGRRPIRAGDVMVLARTGRECAAVGAALRRRGIPSTLVQSQDLFATREASELADLLRGIANPRSRAARIAAMATRFFDLSLAELARLADDADSSEALAQLYRWKAAADRFRFETLFPAIASESRLFERELALGRGSRSITNIEHLFEVLTAEVVRSRCSLAELCQRLDARIAAATRGQWTAPSEPTPLRIEPELEAVSLMTAHAAKGLEAEVVFVVGGYSRRPIRAEKLHTYHDDDDRRRLHVGRPPEELDERILAEVRGEDERLMYVAITRAASRLYLIDVPPGVFRVSGSYAPLCERLSDARAPLFARRRQSQQPTSPAARPALAVVGGSVAERAAAPPVSDPQPPADLDRLRAGRAGPPVTSYTRMKRSAGGDLAHQLGRDQPGASGALGRLRAREAGIFLHWLLERIPFSRVRAASDLTGFAADDEIGRLIGAGMRGFDVAPEHRAEVERLLWGGLTAAIEVRGASIGAVIDAERDAREVEFTYPVRGRDGDLVGYIAGFLDVLFERQGRLYVLDWKSDALRDFSPELLAAHNAEQYDVQARLYALALARICGVGIGGDDDVAYQRYGGLVYCYLRAPACLVDRASLEELREIERELAADPEALR
jgi:exodeoxyribonuclease V beta subunit